jgi:8-oxo-dGTP pyrophosphatase MutT (NUDIX family)
VPVPISNSHMREQLHRYLETHTAEEPRLAGLEELLVTGQPLTRRTDMPGHVTATAIITDPAGDLLLVHHRFYNVWWPPGGHLEAEDRTLAGAALREAVEETRIDPSLTELLDPAPFDIEVCDVADNPAKCEGPHQHFDFRYLFTAPRMPLHPQQEEVHEVAWRPIGTLEAPALAAALLRRVKSDVPADRRPSRCDSVHRHVTTDSEETAHRAPLRAPCPSTLWDLFPGTRPRFPSRLASPTCLVAPLDCRGACLVVLIGDRFRAL